MKSAGKAFSKSNRIDESKEAVVMKKYCFFLGLLLVFMLWVLYRVYTSKVDYNPEEPSVSTRQFFVRVLPQGWSFFTDDPQEPMLEVYTVHRRHGRNIIRTFLLPSGDYCFGASRYARALLYQMKSVVPQVPVARWKHGVGDFRDSLEQIVTRKTTLRQNNKYSLLPPGNYLLVYADRVPWVLAGNPLANKRQYRMAYITII